MESRFMVEKISPRAGSELGTAGSVGQRLIDLATGNPNRQRGSSKTYGIRTSRTKRQLAPRHLAQMKRRTKTIRLIF